MEATALDAAWRDPEMVARFATAYRGRSAPKDALWWLAHPDEAAPSGAASPTVELVRLRRELYRPGAGREQQAAFEWTAAQWRRQQDLAQAAWLQLQASVRRAEEAERSRSVPAGSAAVPRWPRRWRWVRRVAVAGAGTGVLLGGLAALQGLGDGAGSTASSLVPAVVTPEVGDAARLQSQVFAAPESYAAAVAVERVADRTDAASPWAHRLLRAGSSAQGAGMSTTGRAVTVDGSYVHDLEAGSRLYVQVLTKRPVGWRWRVVGVSAGRPTPHLVELVEGAAGTGRLQEALLRLPVGVTPVRFEIETDAATPFRWRSITDGSSRPGR